MTVETEARLEIAMGLLERANSPSVDWTRRYYDFLDSHPAVPARTELDERLAVAAALLERAQRRGPTRGDGMLYGDIKAFLNKIGELK